MKAPTTEKFAMTYAMQATAVGVMLLLLVLIAVIINIVNIVAMLCSKLHLNIS